MNYNDLLLLDYMPSLLAELRELFCTGEPGAMNYCCVCYSSLSANALFKCVEPAVSIVAEMAC